MVDFYCYVSLLEGTLFETVASNGILEISTILNASLFTKIFEFFHSQFPMFSTQGPNTYSSSHPYSKSSPHTGIINICIDIFHVSSVSSMYPSFQCPTDTHPETAP